MLQLSLFDTARCEDLRADKFSTIVIDSCQYSVPDTYAVKRYLPKYILKNTILHLILQFKL